MGNNTKPCKIGERYNNLTVLEECKERDKYGSVQYKCICDCGNLRIVTSHNLRTNRIKSCGCLNHMGKTHGKTYTRLYRVYCGMKGRCYTKHNSSYPNYGGRGIKVCDEWLHDFMAFYNWALSNGYNDKLQIDRIDVNGNYEPNNCRWVDRKCNCNNKRNNVLLTYKGETMSMMEWARKLNLNYDMLRRRKNLGWSDYDILNKRKRGDK